MNVFRFIMSFLLYIFWTGSIIAQGSLFPENYVGQWIGELEIFNESGLQQKLEMEIQISKSHHVDTFYYSLKYINAEVVDQRDYLIIKDSLNPNILNIDEQNGIVLDMERFGNKWISIFRIDESVIHFYITLIDNQLLIEVFSISQNDIRLTGGKDGIPTIGILKNSVYQRAVLKKYN